jgi:hypothetical protein
MGNSSNFPPRIRNSRSRGVTKIKCYCIVWEQIYREASSNNILDFNKIYSRNTG